MTFLTEFDDLTSGLSEHSSDNGLPAKHQPAAAAIAATVKTNQTLASEQGEEMDNGDVSSQLAASEAEDGNPITSTPRPEQQMDNKVWMETQHTVTEKAIDVGYVCAWCRNGAHQRKPLTGFWPETEILTLVNSYLEGSQMAQN